MRFGLVASVALFSWSCAERADFSGTFVGDATGTYQPKGGTPQSFTIPGDEVTVKTTSRHYQFSEIEVTVRGCKLASHGSGGQTSWTLSSGRGGAACTINVPTLGPVPMKLTGGLARSANGNDVHLSFSGDTDKGDNLRYSLDAKPRK